MMRKGPLERFPVEHVLRDAADDELTGALRIEGDVSGIVYFERGLISFARIDQCPVPPEIGAGAESPADAMHAQVVAVLATLCEQRAGTYECLASHHPLAWRSGPTRCRLHVDDVLAEVAARADRAPALRAWSSSLVRVGATPPPVGLDSDCWEVIASMTYPTALAQLSDRLGWDADRLARALTLLRDQHLILPQQPTRPAETPLPWDGRVDVRARPLAVGLPQPTRHAPSGPIDSKRLEEFAAATDDSDASRRRSALGRLISSLRK